MLFSVKHLAYGGVFVTPDGIFYWSLGLLIFPFFVNIFTFARLYYLKRKTNQNAANFKDIKKNMALFFQIIFQDSLFFISVAFTMKMK